MRVTRALAVAALLLFVISVLPLLSAVETVEDGSAPATALVLGVAFLLARHAEGTARIELTPIPVTSPFWTDRDDVVRR